MATIVLEVQFIDAMQSTDKEFTSLEDVLTYLNGQRESDFDWLTLYDNNTEIDVGGWSEIHQYIRENTGEVKHDLSVCGEACNCMKCNPSKSSCIALRAAELGLPHIDSSMTNNVKPVPFSELPDGALFYIAQTYVYGNHTVFRKALEDGGEHNAVHVVNTNVTTTLPNDCMVIPA